MKQSLDRIPYGSQMAVVPLLPFTPEDKLHCAGFFTGAKLHKEDRPDIRFICSSASSSMRVHLVWANRLLNAFLPELDAVYGAVYRHIGADAAWVARSWTFKNTAAFIPVLEVWNTQYACCSPSAPLMAACDFARLYSLSHKFRSGPLHCWRLQCTL